MKNTRLTTTPPSSLPCIRPKRPRVYVQNVPVYAGTTRTCEPVGTSTALDMPAFENLVSIVKFGTETNTLAQSGRLRNAVRFLLFLCYSPHLHLLPTQFLPQLQGSVKQSLKSRGPCGRSKPAHRNVFGSATTSIRWTGSKWSRRRR